MTHIRLFGCRLLSRRLARSFVTGATRAARQSHPRYGDGADAHRQSSIVDS